MLASAIFAILGLTASIAAAPINNRTGTITDQNLYKIAPDTASCSDADREWPEECVTATVAAPNIAKSFKEYHIESFGAQAALVALMLFETANFKYSVHHFGPKNPGQGTRNMQSPANNELYAKYLAAHNVCGVTKEEVTTALASKTPALATLALVNRNDHLSFGSAAWYLRTQCPKSIEQGLANGTEAAFTSYVTDCVHTTQDADRLAIWEKVIALKHW